MKTSGKVLKDFENLRKSLFNEEISHFAFMRDGKVEILYTQKHIDKLEQKIVKLHSIIKEVREWANKTIFYFDFKEEITKHAFDLLYTKQGQELLEILDKEVN